MMKKFANPWITMVLIVLPIVLDAQSNWVSFRNQFPVKEYEGKPFRLTAMVRVETVDDSASAGIWAKVYTEKGFGFIDATIWHKLFRSDQWQELSIEGTLDSGAVTLAYGALCSYNGIFHFDDFKIEVETDSGTWEKVLFTDYESDVPNLAEEIERWKSTDFKEYDAKIMEDTRPDIHKHLVIIGEGVPNYGVNDEVGKYADVNGIRLYYEIYGSGQPLVVLHGNGGSIGDASMFYPHLIERYQVIAIDSRGQGRSSDADTALTYEQMAKDVNALLDKINLDSVLIYGHSDGAILGLILAIENPDKVKKLLAFGANIQPDSSAIFPFFINYIIQEIQTDSNAMNRKLGQLMLDHPNIPFSRLSGIKAPVMIMAGDRDVIRPEHTLKLFQHIPNSQLCIIPGSTHSAPWEKRELFFQIMDEFFESPFTMPDTKDYYARD